MSPRSGLSLPTLAAFLHEGLTALAVIAIVWLFLAHWYNGHPLLHPYAALAVVVTLFVGCGFGRACLRRINQISGNDDVSALLEEAYRYRSGTSRPRALSPLLQAVIPVQIIATAAIALALIVLIQQPALHPAPKQASAGSSQGLAPADTQGQPGSAAREPPLAAQPAGDADSEWTMWPAVAAIALSELMFIGWMFEGEAVADELAAVSRRWTRRRAPDKQMPATDPFAEAPSAPAAPRLAALATATLAAATLAAATLAAATLAAAATKDVGSSGTQAPEPSRTDTPPPRPAVVEAAVAALAATLAATLAAATPDAAPPEGSRADTPPPGPAEVEAAVAPVRRALYLCTLLRQYGVDLTPEGCELD